MISYDQQYRDGWADGEQWVEDHLWEYAVLRTRAGRALWRLRSRWRARLGRREQHDGTFPLVDVDPDQVQPLIDADPPAGSCGHTIEAILSGGPLTCSLPADHCGAHQEPGGASWSTVGEGWRLRPPACS